MKILITGFDPFGGEAVNPAFEAVKLVADTIKGAQIIKLEIPTVFTRSSDVVEAAILQHQPDVVLNVGQAGGRSHMTVEKVAINLAEARIPDNDGEQPLGTKLREDGETAYFATIPVKAIVQHMKDNGIPASVSYTAGTYVCNSIMYHVLYLTATKYPGIRAGFIHVPYATVQAVDKPVGTPFMSLTEIARALELAVEAIIDNKDDQNLAMGTTH